jgi:hypothetical protein
MQSTFQVVKITPNYYTKEDFGDYNSNIGKIKSLTLKLESLNKVSMQTAYDVIIKGFKVKDNV